MKNKPDFLGTIRRKPVIRCDTRVCSSVYRYFLPFFN